MLELDEAVDLNRVFDDSILSNRVISGTLIRVRQRQAWVCSGEQARASEAAAGIWACIEMIMDVIGASPCSLLRD